MKQGALYQVQLEVGSENPIHEVIGTSSNLSKIDEFVKNDMSFLMDLDEDNTFECRCESTPDEMNISLMKVYFPALKTEPEGKGWLECLKNAPRIVYRVIALSDVEA